MKTTSIATLVVALIGITFTSCERKPESVGEKVKDGLDMRPNEKLKDAGEDVKDAAGDAADAVKDGVR